MAFNAENTVKYARPDQTKNAQMPPFWMVFEFLHQNGSLGKKIINQASLYLIKFAKLSYENSLFALGILLIGKRGGWG